MLGFLAIVVFGIFLFSPVICLLMVYVIKKPAFRGLITTSAIVLYVCGFSVSYFRWHVIFPSVSVSAGVAIYGLYQAILILIVMLFWKALSRRNKALKSFK